ncbi:MAG: 4Fe-4S binding protein [Bacteroidales bacterium]|nr:4Fe-4S binding protein [Bacteroidales bacterium]
MKKARIALAAVFLTGITLLFLDTTGTLRLWLGWMAKVQFLPAVLALNVAVIAALCVITLLLGRVYCSVICPLGILQDVISFFSGLRKGKKHRFHFRKEIAWLRYGVLALYILAIILGIQIFVALLAPYSAYGRMISSILHPSLATGIIAGVTLLAIIILAWTGGRTYCNTVCPVGTTLSFLSRFAMFRPVIDAEKCKDCHLCEKSCKASCIDIANHKIDYSRCVDCFDCLGECRFDALHYRFAWGKKKDEAPAEGVSRRAFVATSAILAGTATLHAQKKLDGGLAPVIDKENPSRETPLTPFGASRNFYDKCTACQLCITKCPNGVLRPSTDITRLMQPEMGYENGWCRPECVRCSEVCPTGAIEKITPEEKTSIHIGTAKVDRSLCVVETKGVHCGNCARHCPTGAITMVASDPDDPDSLKIPAVNEELCIGCGACEFLCPSRPVSAITVDGLHIHRKD